MSVLVHAMLVQALAGNAVIAKTPTDGGSACLTLACALAAREGLPLTLVSGGGGSRRSAVRAPEIGCVSFVGGRTPAPLATAVADLGKRHVLEAGGPQLLGRLELLGLGGADTAHPQDLRLRQAALHRLPALRRPAQALRRLPGRVPAGGPFPALRAPAGGVTGRRCFSFSPSSPSSDGETPCPELDFGPLINAAKAKELAAQVARGHRPRRRPLHRGSPDSGRFLPGQDTSAYLPPTTLLAPPPSSPLHHAEPFGPVDTIVLVDTEAELLAAMNAGNGALVADPLHRRPGRLRPARATHPRLQDRPRQARVRAATATSSSAANCWSVPSATAPATNASPETSPTTAAGRTRSPLPGGPTDRRRRRPRGSPHGRPRVWQYRGEAPSEGLIW